jgi:von Willebrand factor type A domain-containing protein
MTRTSGTSHVVATGTGSNRPAVLVGLLVDVSGSMSASIRNRSGGSSTRLQAFRESLGKVVERARNLAQVGIGRQVSPNISVFAYGFGFGGPLAALFGPGESVRDLLKPSGQDNSLISVDVLAEQWSRFQAHIESLVPSMFGSTPMAAAFRTAHDRIIAEQSRSSYAYPPLLFVLTDGQPTDAKEPEILQLAEQLRELPVTLVSCFITSEDIAEARRLYAEPVDGWPPEANLLFKCSSTISDDASFAEALQAQGWRVDDSAHLFTQINQSEILDEFLSSVMESAHAGSRGTGGALPTTNEVDSAAMTEPFLEVVQPQLAKPSPESTTSITAATTTMTNKPHTQSSANLPLTVVVLAFALAGFVLITWPGNLLWLIFWIVAYPLAIGFGTGQQLQNGDLVEVYKAGVAQIPVLGKLINAGGRDPS